MLDLGSGQNIGYLLEIGDYTTQLYRDDNKPRQRSLSTNDYTGMSQGFVSRFSKNRPCDGNPTSKDSRFFVFLCALDLEGWFLSFFFRVYLIKKSRHHCLADSQVVRTEGPSVCFFRKHLGAGFQNFTCSPLSAEMIFQVG